MGIEDMDSTTLTWLLGLFVTVLSAILGWVLRQKNAEHGAMWRKMDALATANVETQKQAAADLSAYKLYVAENYISVKTFEKFEDRVIKALEDLRREVLRRNDE